MAEKPKLDPLEEAHFRLDEHERALHDIRKVGDSIPSLVDGGVAALHASMKAELAELRAGQAADVESDRAVAESNKALALEIKELCADIKALVKALCTPTTRTATMTLPSGPATMTVRETRKLDA